ncbi:hypothetical protein GCM10009600_31190 [Oerskovia paurometabola]
MAQLAEGRAVAVRDGADLAGRAVAEGVGRGAQGGSSGRVVVRASAEGAHENYRFVPVRGQMAPAGGRRVENLLPPGALGSSGRACRFDGALSCGGQSTHV